MNELIEAGELQAKKLAPLMYLLGQWLTQPSVGMVYGWRGSGKSFFALSVAFALASAGKFLKWRSVAPSRVLYVDGELGERVLRDRQELVLEGSETEITGDNLYYATFESTGGIIPNLVEKSGQDKYSSWLSDRHVAIIDNISTCIRPVARQSEVDAWAAVQPWITKERGRGKSILFVHHAGKSGAQRGTSTREDVLDYVIALRQPPNYSIQDGCVFELHFEKARGFFGEEAAPLACRLVKKGNGLNWEWKNLDESRETEILELADQGYSVADIASILKMEPGRVKFSLNKKERRYGSKKVEDEMF